MKDPFALPADHKPRKKTVRLTEGKIQTACVAYARSKGYWARKFSSPSQRSVPDYLFGKLFRVYQGRGVDPTSHAVKWAEEFKAPKQHSTEKQLEEQKLMRDHGWTVITDTGTNGQADIDAFKARIDTLEKQYG
jgi:hypothetical protein